MLYVNAVVELNIRSAVENRLSIDDIESLGFNLEESRSYENGDGQNIFEYEFSYGASYFRYLLSYFNWYVGDKEDLIERITLVIKRHYDERDKTVVAFIGNIETKSELETIFKCVTRM